MFCEFSLEFDELSDGHLGADGVDGEYKVAETNRAGQSKQVHATQGVEHIISLDEVVINTPGEVCIRSESVEVAEARVLSMVFSQILIGRVRLMVQLVLRGLEQRVRQRVREVV